MAYADPHGRDQSHITGDDPPFACPADIVLRLPAPPPVNQTRRINWAKHKKHMDWRRRADMSVMMIRPKDRKPIYGSYTIDVVVDESLSRLDLDATIKAVIDYCVDRQLVTGDGSRWLRGLSMSWGKVESGFLRVTLRSCE